jgi:hypothetical protein
MLYPVRIIALTGKKGCGKSVASDHISKLYNSHKLSFSTPLKKAISEIFNFRNNECFDSDKKELVDSRWGVSPRELMQKIGTDIFRDRMKEVCPNMIMPYDTIWISNMYFNIREIENIYKYSIYKYNTYIIDDCRFEDEYNFIKNLGGYVVRINKTDRIYSKNDDHSSEKGCSFDFEIDNNGTIEELKIRIDNLIRNNIKW